MESKMSLCSTEARGRAIRPRSCPKTAHDAYLPQPWQRGAGGPVRGGRLQRESEQKDQRHDRMVT